MSAVSFTEWLARQSYDARRAAFRLAAKALLAGTMPGYPNGSAASKRAEAAALLGLLHADLEIVASGPMPAPGGGGSAASMCVDDPDAQHQPEDDRKGNGSGGPHASPVMVAVRGGSGMREEA